MIGFLINRVNLSLQNTLDSYSKDTSVNSRKNRDSLSLQWTSLPYLEVLGDRRAFLASGVLIDTGRPFWSCRILVNYLIKNYALCKLMLKYQLIQSSSLSGLNTQDQEKRHTSSCWTKDHDHITKSRFYYYGDNRVFRVYVLNPEQNMENRFYRRICAARRWIR